MSQSSQCAGSADPKGLVVYHRVPALGEMFQNLWGWRQRPAPHVEVTMSLISEALSSKSQSPRWRWQVAALAPALRDPFTPQEPAAFCFASGNWAAWPPWEPSYSFSERENWFVKHTSALLRRGRFILSASHTSRFQSPALKPVMGEAGTLRFSSWQIQNVKV